CSHLGPISFVSVRSLLAAEQFRATYMSYEVLHWGHLFGWVNDDDGLRGDDAARSRAGGGGFPLQRGASAALASDDDRREPVRARREAGADGQRGPVGGRVVGAGRADLGRVALDGRRLRLLG